jgi:hypothetical protein
LKAYIQKVFPNTEYPEDKIIYLIWKNGDHLHQTDMGFVTGNIFNKVKRSDLSL